MSANSADRIEDLEFMDESGVTATEAASRAGFASPEAMERWLYRHDANDLWLSFKKREAPGVHGKQARASAVGPDSIAALITRAQASTRKRTRSRADRASEIVAELRALVRDEAVQDAADAEAREEIQKLERDLARARAKLKRGTKVATTGPSAAEIRAWASGRGLDCPAMGRVPVAIREAFQAAQSDAAA